MKTVEGKKVQDHMMDQVIEVGDVICGVYMYIDKAGQLGVRMANQSPQRLLYMNYFMSRVIDQEFEKRVIEDKKPVVFEDVN